jgi:hypothetical protein
LTNEFLSYEVLCISILLLFALINKINAQRVETLFDDNWKFSKDSSANAEAETYNDAGWRTVHLPHDWSVEDFPNQSSDSVAGPFTKNSIGKTATGYTVGGTAWYRKHFTLRKQIKGDKNDLSYITATVVDANGNIVPDTTFTLHFTATGNGAVIATANVNPTDIASFR